MTTEGSEQSHQEQPLPEVRAEKILTGTLNKYRQALRILRAREQLRTFTVPEDESLNQLIRSFQEASRGLNLTGRLSQLTDTDTFHHDPDTFYKAGKVIAVRGFEVGFETEGIKFQCFIFDPGKPNRIYYDNKSQDEQQKFFENYTKRTVLTLMDNYVQNPNSPPFFTAFVNQGQFGRCSVERIVQVK